MKCSFNEDKKVMTVEASEHGTREDLNRFLDEAVAHYHKHGKIKMLLSWLNYRTNAIEVQKAGIYASANMKTMFSKIALVCKPEHRKEAAKWKAATALNIRIFLPDEGEALQQWLRD